MCGVAFSELLPSLHITSYLHPLHAVTMDFRHILVNDVDPSFLLSAWPSSWVVARITKRSHRKACNAQLSFTFLVSLPAQVHCLFLWITSQLSSLSAQMRASASRVVRLIQSTYGSKVSSGSWLRDTEKFVNVWSSSFSESVRCCALLVIRRLDDRIMRSICRCVRLSRFSSPTVMVHDALP